MLAKTTILKTIDAAYAARKKSDKASLAKYWAKNATYRLVGASLPPKLPSGARNAKQSVEALIDLFEFKKLKRLGALVDGNNAAVHWRVTLSTKGGSPETTELYDFWEFSAKGKAKSLTQFADTALLHRMVTEG